MCKVINLHFHWDIFFFFGASFLTVKHWFYAFALYITKYVFPIQLDWFLTDNERKTLLSVFLKLKFSNLHIISSLPFLLSPQLFQCPIPMILQICGCPPKSRKAKLVYLVISIKKLKHITCFNTVMWYKWNLQGLWHPAQALLID